jgi:tetratricopeptide (TPR) repeat protein
MTTSNGINHRARCEQLLREAEAFEQVEDWDNAVAKYRELNELDHLFEGAEAKLLFAVRERDCFRNYTEGKQLMAAGRYAEARDAFRKAKARAGVYKDTAALLAECEKKLQGNTAASTTAPARAKGCLAALLLFMY